MLNQICKGGQYARFHGICQSAMGYIMHPLGCFAGTTSIAWHFSCASSCGSLWCVINMSKKLVKSTGTVAGMTMVSRVLGFVRDVVLAASFGASPAFDAFVIAFKIPNFFRRLFARKIYSRCFCLMQWI